MILAFCSRRVQSLFLQCDGDARTSVVGPAGVLHCTQNVIQKNVNCIHRICPIAFGSQGVERLVSAVDEFT